MLLFHYYHSKKVKKELIILFLANSFKKGQMATLGDGAKKEDKKLILESIQNMSSNVKINKSYRLKESWPPEGLRKGM